MKCSLSMQIKQVLIQGLELTGGISRSIFPDVEALIFGSSDYQNALEYVASRKKMTRYRSVMDFLFCELHPQWRISCRRFYAGNGPLLVELIDQDQIEMYSNRMLKAIEVAYELYSEQRCNSWNEFVRHVEKAIEAA